MGVGLEDHGDQLMKVDSTLLGLEIQDLLVLLFEEIDVYSLVRTAEDLGFSQQPLESPMLLGSVCEHIF